MLATLGGILALIVGLALLLLPVLVSELSRPRDSGWGAVVLLLGLVLVTSAERLTGAPMLAVLCGGLLIGRLGTEVAQARWRQLSSEEQAALRSSERWRTSLDQLLTVVGQLIAALLQTLTTLKQVLSQSLGQRRQSQGSGKRWIRQEPVPSPEAELAGTEAAESPQPPLASDLDEAIPEAQASPADRPGADEAVDGGGSLVEADIADGDTREGSAAESLSEAEPPWADLVDQPIDDGSPATADAVGTTPDAEPQARAGGNGAAMVDGPEAQADVSGDQMVAGSKAKADVTAAEMVDGSQGEADLNGTEANDGSQAETDLIAAPTDEGPQAETNVDGATTVDGGQADTSVVEGSIAEGLWVEHQAGGAEAATSEGTWAEADVMAAGADGDAAAEPLIAAQEVTAETDVGPELPLGEVGPEAASDPDADPDQAEAAPGASSGHRTAAPNPALTSTSTAELTVEPLQVVASFEEIDALLEPSPRRRIEPDPIVDVEVEEMEAGEARSGLFSSTVQRSGDAAERR